MNQIMSTDEILMNSYKKSGTINESDRELLPVYNINRVLLGMAPRLLCHRLGLIHKVAYLLIIENTGKILLQTRGDGRLDMAVGGHVSSSDSTELNALLREAKEELSLNIESNDVKYVGSYFREYEFNAKRPEEFNREIRELYCLKLNSLRVEEINNNFIYRLEQKNVIAATWFNLESVLDACNKGNVADGLKSSIQYYLKYFDKNEIII